MVEDCPNIAGSGTSMEISMWPNPVLDQLQVRVKNAPQGRVELMVFDALGRTMVPVQMFYAPAEEQIMTVNVAGLEKGTYQVVLSDTSGRVSESFLKVD